MNTPATDAAELSYIAEPLRHLAVPIDSLVLDLANVRPRRRNAKDIAQVVRRRSSTRCSRLLPCDRGSP